MDNHQQRRAGAHDDHGGCNRRHRNAASPPHLEEMEAAPFFCQLNATELCFPAEAEAMPSPARKTSHHHSAGLCMERPFAGQPIESSQVKEEAPIVTPG